MEPEQACGGAARDFALPAMLALRFASRSGHDNLRAMDSVAALPRRLTRLNGWDALFAALSLAAGIKLFRVAELNDKDFHVYWKAAQDFVAHLPIYAPNLEDLSSSTRHGRSRFFIRSPFSAGSPHAHFGSELKLYR